MTPQELKNSILQLAIQGRLVEQRPAEGTAQELYALIRAEQRRLIQEGRLRKRKPLPEITEEEKPFDLPESWMWVRHNALLEIIGGSQPPKSSFLDTEREGYVRLYQIRDYGERPVPVYVPRNSVSKFSVEGDILLARYGGSLGKVFWAKTGAYNVAMAKAAFLFESDYLWKPYVFYYYLAPLYQRLVRNNSRSAQAGFNRGDLNSLLFPLPPLAEQRRIAAKLEELLPLTDRYEAAWTRLEDFSRRFPEDMRRSLLQQAAQGRLVEQRPAEGTARELYAQIQAEKQRLIQAGIIRKEQPLPEITEAEKPFDIPESWMWVRLGDIFQHNTGKALNTASQSGECLEYITTSNLYWDHFELDHLKKMCFSEAEIEKCTVRKGDLLVCEGGDFGRSAVWPFDREMRIQNHIHRLRPYGAVSVRYFSHLFYLYKHAGWIGGKGIGIQGLSSKALHGLVFPLPPLAEQKRIVARLEELLPLCGALG